MEANFGNGQAAVFADVVGVACGGICYEGASVWSKVALEHGDDVVPDKSACRDLCATTDGCGVFTWEGGVCHLMRGLESDATPVLAEGESAAVSGTGVCGESFLSFPATAAAAAILTGAMNAPNASASNCTTDNFVYGFGAGSCGTTTVLKVLATEAMLSRGTQEGWWPVGAEPVEVASEPSAASCQSWCASSDGCGGWSLSSGVCALRSTLDCSPAFGVAPDHAVPVQLLGAEQVSGLAEGCVQNSDLPSAERCGLPRCTVPTLDGAAFFATSGGARRDTLLLPQCYYEVYEREPAFSRLGGSWVVVAAGSNGLNAAMALGNLFEPGMFTTNTDRSLEGLDTYLIDAVWTKSANASGFTLAYFRRFSSNDFAFTPSRNRLAADFALAGNYTGVWSLRLSYVRTRKFREVQQMLPLIATPSNGWGAAPLVLNVMTTRRLDLGDMRAELAAFLGAAEQICSEARHACFLWSDTGNTHVHRQEALAMALTDYRHANLVDVYKLSQLMPSSEILHSHGGPFLWIWTWQLVLNALPHADASDEVPFQCARALVASEACHVDAYCDSCGCQSKDVTSDDCSCSFKDNWACVNERIDCTYTQTTFIGESVGALSAQRDLAPELTRDLLVWDECVYWCAGPGAAWAMATGALLLSIGYKTVRSCMLPPPASLPPKSAVKREHLAGLNFARILASIHIVIGHLYAKGAVANVYLFSWGFTWVPWFFMLSGYVLTHAQLSRKDPSKVDDALSFVRKRTSAIFPLYAAGLLLALLVQVSFGRRLPSWYSLASQGLLVQAWVPWLTERTIQLHCWFLSAMVPYWALYGVFFRYLVLRLSGVRASALALFLLALPPWFSFMFPAVLSGEDYGEWYKSHKTGSLASAESLLVVFLKFHPFSYLHVFLFGMCLARLRERYKVHTETIPTTVLGASRSTGGAGASCALGFVGFCLRWGTLMGYAGLLIIFCTPQIKPYAHKLSARLSILMPLQALVLLGCSPLLPAPKATPTVPGAGNDKAKTGEPAHEDAGDDAASRHQGIDVEVRLSSTDEAPAAVPWQEPSAAEASRWLAPLRSGLWMSCAAAREARLFVCAPYDPVARIFMHAPAWWGNVSYGQYVLQMICYQLWPVKPLGDTLFPFFIFLLSLSWLSAQLIIVPGQRWWLKQAPPRAWRLVALPVALACFLGGVTALYDLLRTKDAYAPAPPFVRVAPECVDVRLNWTSTFESDSRALINPSILVYTNGMGDTRLVRAARAHALHETTQPALWDVDGVTREVTQVTTRWDSDIVLQDGPAPSFHGWDPESWGLDGTAPLSLAALGVRLTGEGAGSWAPLAEGAPRFIAENMTLMRRVVTGPEDPKLLGLGGPRWGVVFSSLPPRAHGNNDSTANGSATVQMHMAHDGASLASSDVGAVGMRLDCGETTLPEKNWIGFTAAGSLYFVYSVEPHVVVNARAADGACVQRYSSSYPPLSNLASVKGIALHGSGTATRYDRDGVESYLALFHALDSNSGRYTTFAYTFAAAPPFNVLSVSAALPLQGSGHANFASGLLPRSEDDASHSASSEKKIVVTYGAADAEARALVFSETYMAEMFCLATYFCAPRTP